jgi:hypothetical protein
VVLRVIVNEIDNSAAQKLTNEVGGVRALVNATAPDRAQIASRATATAEIADGLARRFATVSFDQPMSMRLMKAIIADADLIAAQDERAAEQAAMAIDSLFLAYSKGSRNEGNDAMRSAIRQLFHSLDDPSSYNAPKFAAQLRALNGLLK